MAADGYEGEGQALAAHFESEWDDETPIAWPNADFDPPDGAPWVRFTLRSADANQADMAPDPRFRHDGAVIVQVFVPKGAGSGRALELGDRAAALFRATTIGPAVFRAPRIDEIGDDGRGWWQVNVIAPYFRDTVF